MKTERLIPDKGWARVGPGRGIELDVTDREIEQVLRERLPDEFKPYTLVTVESQKKGRVYEWTAQQHQIAEFARLCASGQSHYFVRSIRLHPRVDWSDFTHPQFVCSLSGMINIRQHHETSGNLRSGIGIVWKVGHLVTYEVVEHTEYLKIFNSLRNGFRALKRRKETDSGTRTKRTKKKTS